MSKCGPSVRIPSTHPRLANVELVRRGFLCGIPGLVPLPLDQDPRLAYSQYDMPINPTNPNSTPRPRPEPRGPYDLVLSLLPSHITDDHPLSPPSPPAALLSLRFTDGFASVDGHSSPTPLSVSVGVMLTLSQAADLHNILCDWIKAKTTTDTRPSTATCFDLHIQDPL